MIVCVENVKSLQVRLDLTHTLHYNYSRGINKPLVYYLCVGEPIYASPSKQDNAGHVFARLRYYSRRDRYITQLLGNLYLKKK